MKVHLWCMGSASDDWVIQGEKLYTKRLNRYLPFEYKCVQISKNKDQTKVLAEEGKWLIAQLDSTPTKLILLDEKGPQLTSLKFSERLDTWRQGNHKRLVFLIGSAYGFDKTVYDRADELLGLSAMTLPHQLCRLMMLEQLYRACTILRGESYHHE